MKRLIAALAAASILAGTPAAQAANISKASPPVEGANTLGSGSGALLIALAALLAALSLVADSDSSPDSP